MKIQYSPLIYLSLVTGLFFASCKDKDPTIAQITVVDKNNVPVSGAKVRVYCSPAPCDVESIQTSDASGLSTHEFKLPAVLKIEATKDTGTIMLGEGYVKLEEHETVQQTVTML
jgi:myo-inositol-hexaphosphate 3-phosphohydrolase